MDGRANGGEGTSEPSFEEIARLAGDFRASRVLLTAVELDLFSHLGSDPLDVPALARSVRGQERGVGLLANALVGLGLLALNEEGYACTPLSRRFLDKASPDYRGSVVRLGCWWWSRWSELTEVVKTGVAPDGPPAEMIEDFTLAMLQGKPDAGALLVQKLDLHGVRRVVDLGGGPGGIAQALAQALPEAQVIVVDRPEVIAVAQRHVPADLLGNRVVFEARDFINDGIPLAGDPPGPYDLALLSSIVHLLGEEENVALLGRIHDALVPGGRVVIRDFLVDESGVEPLDAALFAITMLVSSQKGRCYGFDRMKGWLNGSGFGEVEQRDFDGPVALITARRA